jgi:hypothetical protein
MKQNVILESILLIIFNLWLIHTGCSPTDSPIEYEDTEPGSRNYTWTVDTISSPPNLFYLFSLWGSSPTNLWAAGSADSYENALWHYDGNSWEKTTQRLSTSMPSIHGFDSTDIWACGSQGEYVYHYDGMSWIQLGPFPNPGYSSTSRNNIWGPKPNEIYSAGFAYDKEKGTLATLLKYDGNNWNYINLPDKEMSFNLVRKSRENSLLYITAIQFLSTGDLYKIFTYNGKTLNEIHSGENLAYAYEMNGRIYLCIGKKIYKHIKNQLVIWKDFSQTTYLGRIFGRSEKDFFGIAEDGLAHYNGTDLKTIYPTSFFINDVFVMENDIFMICENRIIVHGKLNTDN